MRDAVLAISNLPDCRRYGFSSAHLSPWNWASKWVLEMAAPHCAERVLDLGCRDNPYVLAYTQQTQCSTVLLDMAPPSSDTVLPAGATFQQHDLRQPLPFPDGSFDVVLSESSLEHLRSPDRIACLVEARRVLRPAGRLAISIGLPLNVGGDPKTVEAFATHPFFASRFCSVFLPVDVAAMLDALNLAAPYNAALFPGFPGFSEQRLLDDHQLCFDYYRNHEVPNVGRLPQVVVVEVGLFATK